MAVPTMPRRVARRALTFAVLLAAMLILSRASMAQQDGKAADPAADTRAAAAAKAPAADDSRIAPFIGPDTFVVGRLDVGRVDMAVMEAYAARMAEAIGKHMATVLPPAGIAEMKSEVARTTTMMGEKLTQFAAAGGHHVYVLIQPMDLAGGGQPLVVTPLGEGADRAKLEELLAGLDGDATATAEIAGALVFGTQASLDALKERMDAAGGKPAAGAERPDLAAAFAAAGAADVPLRFAILPGEAARTFLEEHHPTLPEEIGGGDIKQVSRGVRWLAAGVTQKPDIRINLTVQAADAKSAKALMALFAKSMAFLKEQAPPEGTLTRELDSLKPKLDGERITLSADPGALQLGMIGVRTEVHVDGNGAKPAEPEQPDDGGL
jgi:hypothetical protein